MVAGSMLAKSEARFGFSFDPSATSPSCTNGPKRPLRASTGMVGVGIGSEDARPDRTAREQFLGALRA